MSTTGTGLQVSQVIRRAGLSHRRRAQIDLWRSGYRPTAPYSVPCVWSSCVCAQCVRVR